MKEFILPERVLKAILDYLAEQPFKDVWEIITAIQQSVKEVKPDEERKA